MTSCVLGGLLAVYLVLLVFTIYVRVQASERVRVGRSVLVGTLTRGGCSDGAAPACSQGDKRDHIMERVPTPEELREFCHLFVRYGTPVLRSDQCVCEAA